MPSCAISVILLLALVAPVSAPPLTLLVTTWSQMRKEGTQHRWDLHSKKRRPVIERELLDTNIYCANALLPVTDKHEKFLYLVAMAQVFADA